ncbi:MAG: hypothetical protein EAX91_10090 [Candidatus Lokiarchaeota archaeon]|nr:hypothetical protein [Candidatus Lokiarchaeota archaeon]
MKRQVFVKLCLIVFIIGINGSYVRYGFSNPAPIQLLNYAGGFIPNEDVNITLLDASVFIDANTEDFNALGEISFNGNYTIFNYDNTTNITIAAPFHFYPTNNCIITVNGSITPYILYNYWEDEAEIWNEYLINRTEIPVYRCFWLLFNITIPKSQFLKISYEFYTPSDIYYPKWGYYYLIYDVGTSRIWNGNITEKVRINIHGNLPDIIYNEEACTIQDCYDGKIYTWNWTNECIDIDYVGVSYYFGSSPTYNPDIFSLIILSLVLIGIIGIPIFIFWYSIHTKRRNKLE